MEKGQIRPPLPQKPPEPIVTEICVGEYVGTPYPYAQFYYNMITTPFGPPPRPPGGEGSHDLLLTFGDPHISGTVGARNVKFRMRIHRQVY